VPATLVALTLVASVPIRAIIGGMPGWLVLCPLLIWAADSHPLLDARTWARWGRCWTEGSSPELRHSFTRIGRDGLINWENMERVANYLREQRVRDAELLCMNDTTHPLYLTLNLTPPVPYVHVDQMMWAFMKKRERLRQELAAARPRFVVSDVRFLSPATNLAEIGANALVHGPVGTDHVEQFRATVYPWHYPAVFRAGDLVVHQITGPPGRIWPDEPEP
jgi:hypothetical protein